MIIEKLLDKNKRDLFIGVLQEAGMLILFAFLYQTVFIKFMQEEKYLFLGSGYWFIFVMSVLPLINLLLKKFKRLIGNIGGVLAYFCLFIPFAMLLGGA